MHRLEWNKTVAAADRIVDRLAELVALVAVAGRVFCNCEIGAFRLLDDAALTAKLTQILKWDTVKTDARILG